MELYERQVTCLCMRYRATATTDVGGFIRYHYIKEDWKETWIRLLNKVILFKISFESSYLELKFYDPNYKWLQPLKVNEENKFHRHLQDRANTECAIHGLLTVFDWICFFLFS